MGKGEPAVMRKQNWPIILSNTIEAWKEKPFAWGESDCLRFPFAAAAAMLDYDVYEKIGVEKYPYDSEAGAKAILDQHFGGDVANFISTVFEEKNPRLAGRGDIVTVLHGGVIFCGVVDSSGRFAAVKAEKGILFVPLTQSVKAWGVE